MEQHDRPMHTVRVSEATRFKYKYARGEEKLRLHYILFYVAPSILWVEGPSTDTTFDLLHPLLIGSIPQGAAFGEPKHGNRADAEMPKGALR